MSCKKEGGSEIFNLMTHSAHFIYRYVSLYHVRKREGGTIFNLIDALDTLYLQICTAISCKKHAHSEIFNLTTHSAHFIYRYVWLYHVRKREGGKYLI